MDIITVKAFAKINLGLEILNKRQDGYHNINTAMNRISLADILHFRKNKEILLNFSSHLDIPLEKNLVYKSIKLMQENYKINFGAEINIEKNIPIGAGLGGGSSDAASTIMGLIELWDIKVPEENHSIIQSIAQKLGADVSFFLNEGTAIATGKGDELEYFDSGLHFYVLIVMPDISISTKWAYENLNERHYSKMKTDLKSTLFEARTNKSILKDKVFNNFELLIFDKFPEIKKIKNKLNDSGAVFALMSGSGASVYGLFETKEEAETASKKFSNYKNFVCELI
ncbi:MAG: 4-(cytidine 5'-diphospho)-2-C-methyl-D-erythritol kinase [Ignavibacteriae bacterium]|nr:4-(cytidine 5'-diphospho)-2-C-methyl-D-erythritol kinase [Ignavibacteriota bacterium]